MTTGSLVADLTAVFTESHGLAAILVSKRSLDQVVACRVSWSTTAKSAAKWLGWPKTPSSSPILDAMAGYDIRVFGDPVLRQVAHDVTNVDGALVKLTEDMIQTMYNAPGLGLAAPQVGVQKRLFVYDLHDGAGAKVLVNPIIQESRGEWSYDEGCLSIPDMSYEIVRPKEIHLTGYDLEGKEVSVEADELLARLYQHELDHLDGKLLLDYLDETQKAEAMRTLRNRMLAVEPKAKPQLQAPAAKNKFGISLPGLK